VPFLGSIVEMVQDPHAFWERQRDYATPGLSWNSIVTKFTVMVTDPATIRHCFNHNRCVAAKNACLTCYNDICLCLVLLWHFCCTSFLY
jgi:hypothetical protein